MICHAIQRGEKDAEKRLFEIVYHELRRMAHGHLRKELPGQTLQTTALVHEAYLKLFQGEDATWENRRHFFGAAAQAMRRILVDRARKRRADKRGGGAVRVPLEDDVPTPERSADLLALDEALERMSKVLPRHTRVVSYRYFLGLTVKETAQLLDVSPRTVDSDWEMAKSWLKREMAGMPTSPP
jgi:RNA polymerase sigma factor (TIGR02999 family)